MSSIAKAFCIALALCLCAGLSFADESGLARKERAWRALDQLTAVELKRVDISTKVTAGEGLQLPAAEWPFKAPYSAQEIGYRLMDFTHAPRWSHVVADAYGVLTKTGYLTQGVTVGMIQQVFEPGAQGQIASKPGDIHQRQMFFYTYPPHIIKQSSIAITPIGRFPLYFFCTFFSRSTNSFSCFISHTLGFYT